MLPEPSDAHRVRALHALYPIHRTVDFSYDELTDYAQRTVDKVARLIAEIEGPIRELHSPFGIYTECDHDHDEADIENDLAFEVMEVGTVCEDGLMYRVCLSCCTGNGYQTEECVTNHEHGKDEPICKTIATLEKVPA